MLLDHHSPLAKELQPVVGHAFVSDSLETRTQFAVQRCVPGCVVAPATVEELSAVLQVAHTQGAMVAPWGGGTQQALGNAPERLDLVVRTRRLDRILIHEPDDLTISVEAGMTLGALRRHLAACNQMLPIDPPLPDRATIGGLIATAMDGPRRLGFGTLRDLMIGVSVVEASGRMSKAGGMVVKNVSGFDLMKLYHGSLGTLAVIASANFKLLPAPRASALLLCGFSDLAVAFAFLDALHATQLTPTAAEYLSGGALAALGVGGSCAVALLAEGLPQAVERHVRDLQALAVAHGGTAALADDPALWAKIADLPQLAQLDANEAVVKCATLPGDLAATIAQLEATGGQPIISARALNGVAYARLHGCDAVRLTRLAAELPGLQWIATPILGVPRWGHTPAGIATMQRIKREFDQHNTLNRGRFVV